MADTSAWLPTVADVAAILPQRTGDATGAAQGTFTTTTVPTAAQVGEVIQSVQTEIVTACGEIPAALAAVLVSGGGPADTAAGRVAAVGAAAYVELEFWPDMQVGPTSPAAMLMARYKELLAALCRSADVIAGGGDLGDDGEEVPPDYAFPDSIGTGVATGTWERF